MKCEQEKYYCGSTPRWRLQVREDEHRNGVGSKWTARFPPIKIIQVWEFDSKQEARSFEDKKTEEMLNTHGIDSCRGGLCNYGNVGGYRWWVRPHLRHLIPL